MLHEPAVELGVDLASKKKSRLGIILFLVYAAVYTGYAYIGVAHTELLSVKAIGNVNLSIVYGFGIILLAIVMGFVYSLICTKMENEMNRRAQK